ncbi:DUF58 domain-containing protein [Stackebrandtia soli]|uniref:DUF58 domain-containing protein n=1 Tax=Stackebrandtia soli TaxID=1892856 RepID=UPI0039E9FA85
MNDAELRALGGAAGEGKNAVEQLNRLQLLVNNKLDGLLHGDYLGLLPGPGTEPGESREYRPGDDVRRMDWPVTARTTTPHVRTTIADRELETWLAVDLSASLDFGTAKCLKRDLAIAATAAMAHLTVRGGNRIGAVIGAGGSPKVIPAAPGHSGAQMLLRNVAAMRPTLAPVGGRRRRRREEAPGRTDLSALIDTLHRPPRRRGLAVIISDFLATDGWERPIRKLSVRHDVLAIEIVDPRELSLPDVGIVELMDPETGVVQEIQTHDAGFRARYAEAAAAQRDAIASGLRRAGAQRLRLSTDSDWLRDIVRFVAAQRHARTRGTTR